MDKRIEKLFADYGKSFSALDLQNNAKLYAENFVAAGPKGVISQSRKAFNDNAEKAADYYRKAGQKRAEIKSMKEAWYGEKFVMVTIHWAAFFEKLDKPYEFDVSYLVDLTGEDAKIILFISHEDEEEAMKEVARLQKAA